MDKTLGELLTRIATATERSAKANEAATKMISSLVGKHEDDLREKKVIEDITKPIKIVGVTKSEPVKRFVPMVHVDQWYMGVLKSYGAARFAKELDQLGGDEDTIVASLEKAKKYFGPGGKGDGKYTPEYLPKRLLMWVESDINGYRTNTQLSRSAKTVADIWEGDGT